MWDGEGGEREEEFLCSGAERGGPMNDTSAGQCHG